MFEGIEVTGMPDTVISRGEVIVQGEKFLGRAGRGQFIKRAAYTE
jgi:dihydropyrimidinase